MLFKPSQPFFAVGLVPMPVGTGRSRCLGWIRFLVCMTSMSRTVVGLKVQRGLTCAAKQSVSRTVKSRVDTNDRVFPSQKKKQHTAERRRAAHWKQCGKQTSPMHAFSNARSSRAIATRPSTTVPVVIYTPVRVHPLVIAHRSASSMQPQITQNDVPSERALFTT